LGQNGLGLAPIHGTLPHNQHLVWLLALLAASPSADVLSIDAWRKTRKGHSPISLSSPPTLAHSTAMLTAWLLMAIVFFFPGFWKVRTSGLEWISGDNLRLLMYWKWFQNSKIPFFRIDHYPRLCQALAAMAVLFEWTLGPLLLFRRTRPLAVAGLLSFHAFTHVFLHIRYPSLWMCYVMFIDWRAVSRFVQEKPDPDTSARNAKKSSPLPILLVGSFLLAGSFAFGALGIQRGWPFACYPTFEFKPAPVIPRLYIELAFNDNRVEELPIPRETSASRAQKQWGISWSLAGVTDNVDETRLRALVQELVKQPEMASRFRGAHKIRVFRASYSVFPDAWGEPPVKKVMLAEWAIPFF